MSGLVENCNIEIYSDTSKELFKISSDLMGSSGSSPAPDLPKHELPDAFADFFDNKIRQLRENIDTASDGSNTDPFDHDNAFCGQSLAEFEPVSEMEVRETILKCPPKSSEAGPIPTSLLREMISEIVPLLAKLFHASLSSGLVPSAFKAAKVRPPLKKAGLDPNVFKNYRPVSNLLFLSKILEKIVLACLS